MIIRSLSCNFLFTLCLTLCLPSCVKVCLRVGVVYSLFVSGNSSVEVPLWKVLGGHSGNPSVWKRGCRALARTSKHILVFAFGSLYISTFYSLYILHCYSCLYLYMLDIACVFTLVLNQEGYWSISNHNLEESWGEIPESSLEIRTHS